MTTSYDISPTSKLDGLHMLGTVERRFLISYAVPPESLASYVPPGGELSLHNGKAWVSACFVRMGDMRPSFAGEWFGMGYNYLIFRTRARLPFPDGHARESVLVLEPNINSRLLAVAGARITRIQFVRRDIQIHQDEAGWTLQMRHGDELLYDARIATQDGPAMPKGSCFDNAAEADAFLLGVSHGGQWRRETGTLSLLPETHEPWQTRVTTCDTRHCSFLSDLGCTNIEADHVITMTDIPHYFGVRPAQVKIRDVEPQSAAALDSHLRSS